MTHIQLSGIIRTIPGQDVREGVQGFYDAMDKSSKSRLAADQRSEWNHKQIAGWNIATNMACGMHMHAISCYVYIYICYIHMCVSVHVYRYVCMLSMYCSTRSARIDRRELDLSLLFLIGLSLGCSFAHYNHYEPNACDFGATKTSDDFPAWKTVRDGRTIACRTFLDLLKF